MTPNPSFKRTRCSKAQCRPFHSWSIALRIVWRLNSSVRLYTSPMANDELLSAALARKSEIDDVDFKSSFDPGASCIPKSQFLAATFETPMR